MEKQHVSIDERNELFRLHISPLIGFVRDICRMRARAPSHVDDLYNEALINLLKGIHTYDPSKPIKPWIATVTRNFIQKKYSIRKMMVDEYVDVDRLSANLLYYDWELHNNLNDELPPTMMAALEMLVPAQKAAIMMKIQNYSYEEITSRLYENNLIKSLNENTVKGLVSRAKQKLAKLVDREGNLIPPLRKPYKIKPAKISLQKNPTINKTENIAMAKLKSEVEKYISLHEKEYFALIEEHLLMKALKVAGIEELPIYKAAQAIMDDSRVEIHLKPIKRNYR